LRGIAPPTTASWNSKPAPRQGRDAQAGDRELAVTTTLLLHLAVSGGHADDRFAVGHSHLDGVDMDTELACQAFQRDRDMCVAHPPQHGLAGLLDAVDAEHRVF